MAVYLKTRKGARVAVKQRLYQALRNSGMMNHTASQQQAKA